MLVANEVIEQLENGTMEPLAGSFFVKRDPKPETVGKLGLIINPTEVSYIQPDWVTILAAPKKVSNTVNGELISCPLKRGDKVFVKYSDGNRIFDLHQNYEEIRYLTIIAVQDEEGTVIPWLDKVMVMMEEAPKQTASGLWLPDNVEKMSMSHDTGKGTVVAVGHTVREKLESGDYIYYKPHQSHRLEISGSTFMFVAEENLLGVYNV